MPNNGKRASPRFVSIKLPRQNTDRLLAVVAIEIALLAALAAIPEPRSETLVFGFIIAGFLLSTTLLSSFPRLQRSRSLSALYLAIIASAFSLYGYLISRPVPPRFAITNKALYQSQHGQPIRVSISYLNEGEDADFFIFSSRGTFAARQSSDLDIGSPDVDLEIDERKDAKDKLSKFKLDDSGAISLRNGESNSESLGPYSGEGSDEEDFDAGRALFYIAGYVIARSKSGLVTSEEFCGAFQQNGFVYGCPGKAP